MNTVVIGGHTRNIGKTSVMTGLIRAFEPLGWTAVKITQYGHGVCSRDGQPCECQPGEHPFVLSEEQNPRGRGDTCRYLAAGARRSLWLRVRQGQLGDALPVLAPALSDAGWVMIESNSILEFLTPVLYVVVLDSVRQDFKTSARRFLDRADVLVPIESACDTRLWDGVVPESLQGKPVFPVSRRGYTSPELCEFVERKLASAAAIATPHQRFEKSGTTSARR
ncbi:MAG TPA: hypothetical protein VG204_04525 [Terriglobia bacterium]|nr:hypothetical protein [Terriglobia bacterium]